MSKQPNPLYLFLSLSRGSWRNTVYVECTACPFKQNKCNGYLLICDTEGVPILFNAQEIEKITDDLIDKNECAGIISRTTFESLFNRWLVWNINDPKECSILQLISKPNNTL